MEFPDDADDELVPMVPFGLVVLLLPTYTNFVIDVGTTNISWSMACCRYDVTRLRIAVCSISNREDANDDSMLDDDNDDDDAMDDVGGMVVAILC